ncbi:tapasin [Erythrolamprus reginae]|uniref:tapasin n=1 Tax=Erythrolamprus reginae TaxID=121349 RepID=UPI00396CF949
MGGPIWLGRRAPRKTPPAGRHLLGGGGTFSKGQAPPLLHRCPSRVPGRRSKRPQGPAPSSAAESESGPRRTDRAASLRRSSRLSRPGRPAASPAMTAAASSAPTRRRTSPLRPRLLPGCFLSLLLGASLGAASPPTAARLGCWFVEEAGSGGGGAGSVMPSALSQRRALIVLPPPGQRLSEAALEKTLPAEVEPGLAFQLLDASGTLWRGKGASAHPRWGPSALSGPGEAEVACEINPYHPREAHVSWAVGLVGQKGCPRSLEGRWVIATIQNPEVDFGVSSILHQEGPLPGNPEASRITMATAVLSVFTRTPHLEARLGQDVLLDCGFSAPATAFSVEWRHQHGGAGQVVLAYDGTSQSMAVSEEGARLFLDPKSNNISLQLPSTQVRHEGTYICSVYLPHLQAQQAVELKIMQPPKVTLRPVPFPVPVNTHTDLACEIAGYYPQSISVVWSWHSPGAPHKVLLETWESGHRQAPDGTYSFTSFARLPAVQPGDQGGSYSCYVSHVGLGPDGLQKTLKLNVEGSSTPSVEDVIGLFLVTFALLGFLQVLSQQVFGEKKEKKTTTGQSERSSQAPPPEPSQPVASVPKKGQGAGKQQLSGRGSSSPGPTPK